MTTIATLKTSEEVNEEVLSEDKVEDRFELKEIKVIKDIADKDVQVYESIGEFSVAEIEDTIARIEAEKQVWVDRLKTITDLSEEVIK